MQAAKKRCDFLGSEQAKRIRIELQSMIASDLYNTAPSYTTDKSQYPDHLMPFTDKHMNYLNAHPALDVEVYLANVRLMTRTRTAQAL